jgi:GntP family gluconate:H+ symporter
MECSWDFRLLRWRGRSSQLGSHLGSRCPPDNPIADQLGGESTQETPSFGISIFTVLVPVLLILLATVADLFLAEGSSVRALLHFVGQPIIALLLALLFSFWSLSRARNFTKEGAAEVLQRLSRANATILLVIGAGGGFNKVLVQSGVGRAIAAIAVGSHASPLLLAWIVAALIRVATGSATVAMTTAAASSLRLRLQRQAQMHSCSCLRRVQARWSSRM